MRLKQQTQRRDLAQILRRDRRDLKTALPLSDDQPFGDEPAQQFAQRPDARAIVLAQAVELELLARVQLAKNNVGADLAVGLLANRIVFGRSGQHGFDTLDVFSLPPGREGSWPHAAPMIDLASISYIRKNLI